MRRNTFLKNSLLIAVAFSFLGIISCKKEKKKEATETTEVKKEMDSPFFKLSLAQWSIHRMIIDDGMDPYLFAQKAHEWGFEGLEYVSQLYDEELKAENYSEAAMQGFIDKSLAESKKYGLQNLIIMVDGEGDLAAPSKADRDAAVENHKKWIDAAKALGCHSIRVNSFGTNDPAEWEVVAEDGLRKLAEYGATQGIAVLVENHGWLSSDAPLVMKVLNKVNSAYLGTLPDFGNWCIKRVNEERWGDCEEEYPDLYEGIGLLMPRAKAVSAKSYNFDEAGDETKLDYPRILKIVKDGGYEGYIGVEYEGKEISEEEGIIATKNLLLKAEKQIE